jgi:hypothetical protein
MEAVEFSDKLVEVEVLPGEEWITKRRTDGAWRGFSTAFFLGPPVEALP